MLCVRGFPSAALASANDPGGAGERRRRQARDDRDPPPAVLPAWERALRLALDDPLADLDGEPPDQRVARVHDPHATPFARVPRLPVPRRRVGLVPSRRLRVALTGVPGVWCLDSLVFRRLALA